MWHSLWSAEKVARVQLKQFIANLDCKSAFNDEEGIVLLIMKVQGGPLQVSDGCLYEVKAAIYICACNPKRPWVRSNHDGFLSFSLSDDQRRSHKLPPVLNNRYSRSSEIKFARAGGTQLEWLSRFFGRGAQEQLDQWKYDDVCRRKSYRRPATESRPSARRSS